MSTFSVFFVVVFPFYKHVTLFSFETGGDGNETPKADLPSF